MIYDPVWVSTVEHLDQFKTITADTSAAIKRGGRYNVPDDFPQVRIPAFFGLFYAAPAPLVTFSNGKLDLGEHKLLFKAYPMRIMKNKISNLKDDLTFSISADEITSLEHYPFTSPINKAFNISFVRVYTSHEGFLRDFLVCVGGQGLAFEKMRRATANLFYDLKTMASK